MCGSKVAENGNTKVKGPKNSTEVQYIGKYTCYITENNVW